MGTHVYAKAVEVTRLASSDLVSSNPMRASVVETSWGPWHALRMADDRVSVTLVPLVGGRVVSLRDQQTRSRVADAG